MSIASELIQKVKINGKELAGSLIGIGGDAGEFVRKNPATSALTTAGGVLAGVTAVQVVRKARAKSRTTKKKTSTKRKTSTKKRKGTRSKRSWQLDRARRSKEPHELAYQRRKRLAKKSKPKKKPGIYKTKTGQPYKIMANGKARFIKKKGGRK